MVDGVERSGSGFSSRGNVATPILQINYSLICFPSEFSLYVLSDL